MSASTRSILGQSNADRPDGEYAFVAGLYVAALTSPGLVLALSQVVADAAVLYIGLLVAVTGVTAVTSWVVSRTPGLAVILGRHDTVWVLVVVPFGWFGGAFGAPSFGINPPDIAAPLAVLGTAGGMLLGLILVAMSRTRHANAALEDAVEHTQWDARWPRRWRRIAGAVAIVAFTASTIGILAAFVLDSVWGWRLYYLLFVGVVLMNVLNPRTFRVTDVGLVVEHPLQRQFRPWSAYTSYEVADEALVFRSAVWWRISHRCDPDDIADVDAVQSSLTKVFP